MSITGIHPEDLFDKLEDGSLTDAEARELRAHLATCSVCNVDLALRGDFSKDWLAHENATAAPAAVKRTSPRLQALSSPLRRTKSRDASVPAATAVIPSESEPAATRKDPEPAVAPVAPAPASDPGALIDARVTSPSALFSEANRARDVGQRGVASNLYRRLQREFPRSSEAELSRITLALMLLDGGDPRSAVAAFEDYLARPSRPLEGEALVGKARALRALGEAQAEARVWQAVAQRFPGTSYARRATQRLAALGQR